MTVKEAILTLNANIVIACERAGFSSATVKMIEDALDTIEDALKEQESVTIKKTKEPYGYGVYGGICPKCRNWIQSAHSFCGFCGQAVKLE